MKKTNIFQGHNDKANARTTPLRFDIIHERLLPRWDLPVAGVAKKKVNASIQIWFWLYFGVNPNASGASEKTQGSNVDKTMINHPCGNCFHNLFMVMTGGWYGMVDYCFSHITKDAGNKNGRGRLWEWWSSQSHNEIISVPKDLLVQLAGWHTSSHIYIYLIYLR